MRKLLWLFAVVLGLWIVPAMVGAPGGIARAADDDLCGFIKKIVAGAPAEFAPFRGDEDTSIGNDHLMFVGSLTPPSGLTCTLHVRRKYSSEKNTLSPLYSCTLAKDLTYDEAETRYADVSAQVKACLPKWKFTEKKDGGREKRDEGWELKAVKPGIAVSTSFYDVGALADLFSGTTSTKPGVILSLDFEDTAPPKKGQAVPVMDKH